MRIGNKTGGEQVERMTDGRAAGGKTALDGGKKKTDGLS